MRIIFIVSVAVVIILVISAGFKAPSAQPVVAPLEIPSNDNDKFGAIAYSSSTGKTGNSWNYSRLSEAYNKALESCGQNDCEIAIWFRSACGALAVGNNGCWEAHWGANRSDAERKAMNSCSQRCEECRIIASPCTDH